ncbi:MAG: tetratricopeptide repeat protein [Rhodospirillales bacterium]|nr:MAG: tetratricopeptide repeat protein [Rhodospirillales bacterium]
MTGERRRLAAIVAADVVGYSRLMGRDESGTLARLRAHRTERLEPVVARHGGRIVKLTGDGALVEFGSAVDAVSAAVAFQQTMAEANAEAPEDAAIVFRIGVHLGDLIVDGDDLYGDGVNVAARLEAEAPAGGILVSRTVHEAVGGRLKAVFDDLGELSLKNIDRPVRAFRVDWSATDWPLAATAPVPAAGTPTTDAPLALPDRPSIAVLPFTNMSGDPEQEFFADGMAEDIITALSRIGSFFVIARNSTFTYKGKAVDIKQVGRDLGVRYVLEGSVRKSGDRVRVTGQLIDAATGAHVWADRFDGPLADIFDLQDRVTTSVIGAIEPRLRQVEIELARRRRPESLDAYACVMRAMPAVWSFDPGGRAEALAGLERAMALDPGYALPRALAAWCHAQNVSHHGAADLSEERSQALRLAESAARLDSDDAIVLTVLGATYSILRENARAAPLIEKALLLNPNSAWTWQRSGWLALYTERYVVAIEHFERSVRISPLDPLNFLAFVGTGAACFGLERYAEAVAWYEKAIAAQPGATFSLRTLASALAHQGRLDEARDVIRKFQIAHPGVTISVILDALPPTSADYRRRLTDGLRLAGLPE